MDTDSEKEWTDNEDDEETRYDEDDMLHDIFGNDGLVDYEYDASLTDSESDINTYSDEDENEQVHHPSIDRSEEHDLLQTPKYIVSETKLLELIYNQRCHCERRIRPNSVIRGRHVSAAAHYKYCCTGGHSHTWVSTEFYGGKSAVQLLLHLAVLLSGLTWTSFVQGMRFVNVAVGSASNFFRYQKIYRQAIATFWQKKMDTVLEKYRDRSICIAIDVRYDTPGFSANKATAIFMEYQTNEIIHMEIGDSREVERKSSHLERLTINRGMAYLRAKGIHVAEVVTDASKAIIALFQNSMYGEISHSLDVWHKSKKIPQVLGEAAKKKQAKDVLPWIKPIVNHFWWCSANCNGNKERLRTMWLFILRHITNVHQSILYECPHGPLSAAEGKKWLTVGSHPYNIVKSFVTNKQWLGSLKYYSKNRHTSKVENFNSHTLLHYCPKRLKFSLDSYTCRNQLAVLDYNNNHSREVAHRQDGHPYIQGQVSRRTKQWVAYQRLSVKNYNYIEDLTVECMRATYGVTNKCLSKRAQDLDALAPNLSNGMNPGPVHIFHTRQQRSEGSIRRSSTALAERDIEEGNEADVDEEELDEEGHAD